jgi:hypothetical protein
MRSWVLVLLVVVLGVGASACGASSEDAKSADQGLGTPYARIAKCLEGKGIERVQSVDDAPKLWRDIAADNVQDAGGGGSGSTMYRGIRPVGGTETDGDYTAFVIQDISEPYTPKGIADEQPRDALLLYTENGGGSAAVPIRACVGSG